MESSTASSQSPAYTAEEKDTLCTVFKQFTNLQLIEFLKKEDLRLDEDDFAIIRNEKYTGRTFLTLTKDELKSIGMKSGPTIKIMQCIKNMKKKKIRSFSTYKTKEDIEDVLGKYGINDHDVQCIPDFEPRKKCVI